jgi:hypothetical protein
VRLLRPIVGIKYVPPVLRTGGDVDTLAWVKAGADALEFQLPKEELTTGYACALLTQPAERSGWLAD